MTVPRAMAIAATAAALATIAAASDAAAAPSACRISPHPPGWEAIFGYRSTYAAAATLRGKAREVGFKHLVIEQVGCPRWAVALHGLRYRRQARELRAEAARVGFAVTLKCWPVRDPDADWEAFFGSRLTRQQALRLRARAERVGFVGLELVRDPCSNTWSVRLDDIPTLRQARELRAEARRVGFAVTLRQH